MKQAFSIAFAVIMLTPSAGVLARLIENGLEVVARPPQEFLAQIKAEIVSKGQLIKESGAKPD